MSRRVLIAGCGYVGKQLATNLSRRGDEVFGLSRRPDRRPADVHPIAADVTAVDLGSRLPPALDAAVYLVAADGRDDEAYRRAYVAGVQNLVDALGGIAQPPTRLVFVSSTGVYGEHQGGWVDEASPADASHFTGSRVAEGEEIALASPFQTSVLRFGGIYGPGRERLLRTVQEGNFPGAGETWTNRIHRDDGAGAIAHVLDLPSPAPVYNVTDGAPATMAEVVATIADLAGCPRPTATLSAAESPRGKGKRVSADRLLSSGFQLLFPGHREGYEHLWREMQTP